ncbi:ankyrin repeat domain-containing protein [Lysinibacillus xylanilyticus]|uniref:Ankyrin repeat domain-containing protein n=1 Tax=Lysinibacillus xylanilyticus TaxID=582475 RepID=A0ABV3W1X7_9BACI
MKKLFVAIRKGNLELVKELLEKKPELISCTAKQPPKKDDGQSPLQVAIKSGNPDIAEYLLDLGADVNFMEQESCNEWRMPVVHDAIMAAVRCSRYIYLPWGEKEWKLCRTKDQSDKAFHILERMFEKQANINGHDSYGISCLGRAILDARQILPSYNYVEKKLEDKPLNDELNEDLTRIFNLLLKQGANINEVDPRLGQSLSEFYSKEPVAQFFLK